MAGRRTSSVSQNRPDLLQKRQQVDVFRKNAQSKPSKANVKSPSRPRLNTNYWRAADSASQLGGKKTRTSSKWV